MGRGEAFGSHFSKQLSLEPPNNTVADLLLMLEGQHVHLPAPKSHFCKDILFDRDTPIFDTSKHELLFVRGGVVDERETEMMQVRWRIFHLSHQIRQQD